MEKAIDPKPDKPAGEEHGKHGSTKSERTIKADAPPGSREGHLTEFTSVSDVSTL
jgi:hypothetical protein